MRFMKPMNKRNRKNFLIRLLKSYISVNKSVSVRNTCKFELFIALILMRIIECYFGSLCSDWYLLFQFNFFLYEQFMFPENGLFHVSQKKKLKKNTEFILIFRSKRTV